jgi:hypothetical protein
MIIFSTFAEQKFEILNRHKVFVTREDVIDAVSTPDKTNRKGRCFAAYKDGLGVIYKKESEAIKIITFYPVK